MVYLQVTFLLLFLAGAINQRSYCHQGKDEFQSVQYQSYNFQIFLRSTQNRAVYLKKEITYDVLNRINIVVKEAQ